MSVATSGRILIKGDVTLVNGKQVFVLHWPKTNVNRVFTKKRNDHKFNSQHFQISVIVKRQHDIYIAFILELHVEQLSMIQLSLRIRNVVEFQAIYPL